MEMKGFGYKASVFVCCLELQERLGLEMANDVSLNKQTALGQTVMIT